MGLAGPLTVTLPLAPVYMHSTSKLVLFSQFLITVTETTLASKLAIFPLAREAAVIEGLYLSTLPACSDPLSLEFDVQPDIVEQLEDLELTLKEGHDQLAGKPAK